MTEATTAAERLGIRAHTDGPIIPVQARSERFKSVDHDAFEAVTGYESEWKLTPVDRIRDLIDAELDGSPYTVLYPEVAGTSVEWIDRSHALKVLIWSGVPRARTSSVG